MNYYVVTEGFSEKLVYEHWIPLINNGLTYVDHPSKLINNNFSIVSGNGYPGYLSVITGAIEDIKSNPSPTKLVACVDSEDFSYQQKYSEIESHILSLNTQGLNYSIVIQFFCFETWALGNLKIGPRKPKTFELAELKKWFDVLIEDPELLPATNELNRSQLAMVYLRAMIKDKIVRGGYSKSNPSIVQHPSYFQEICSRHIKTAHLGSFSKLLAAFV